MMLTWSSATYAGQYTKIFTDNALNSTISYNTTLCAQTLNGVEVVTVTDFTDFQSEHLD